MRKYLLPGFLLLLDMLILIIASWLAYALRFPAEEQYYMYAGQLTTTMPSYLVTNVVFYFIFRLYSRVWKYAGLPELLCIVGSNLCGTFVFAGVCGLTGEMVPHSIYVLRYFLTVSGIALSRLVLRYVANRTNEEDKEGRKLPVLIIGAGDAGNIIARDIYLRDNRRVVGFLDADTSKHGQYMNGLPIFGDRTKLNQVVEEYGVKEIVIAIPSLPEPELRKIARLCSETNVEVKVLPSFFTSLDTPDIKFKDLRPLQIEDLLEREPVVLDSQAISEYLTDKVVLVTGAGGSIGSEICRQVLKQNPAKVILLGRGENSIYEINRELRDTYPKEQLVPYIMNITNRKGMERVFATHKPQVVFHAAAHKHVPLMEAQPAEAIWNNVFGSWFTAELAGEHGAERFVLISTDKAVNPSSVMGATKRVAEKIIQALNKKYTRTHYMAVRFGNVLGSRGSVVPLFKRQIAAGGPVTVTHPDMKRYFMTIPEASQLVLQAGAMGDGGEVFVLDMGKPVKIMDLAKNMIRLSGYRPGEDIGIRITGLRPGEKLFEELLTAEEGTIATKNKQIFKAILRDEDPLVLKPHLLRLLESTSEEEYIHRLQALLPTYKPNHFKE